MTVAAPKHMEYEDGLRLVPKLLAKGRIDLAARWAIKLCRHHPDDPRAHNQAGIALQRQKNLGDAATHFQRALVLYPATAEIWANLGSAARRAGQPHVALRSWRRAACCSPNTDEIRFALSLGLLTLGDYARGFLEFEHRSERANLLRRFASAGIVAWDRKLVPGQRVLVLAEQGAGDTVQFLRFVQPLADHGVQVTVACPASMERIVASAGGVAATIPKRLSGSLAGYDGVDMLMSLPACLGYDLDTLPAPVRYLVPPPPRLQLSPTTRLRVGLCWTGSPIHPNDEPRRVPFSELSRILELPDIDFYSLQVGPGRECLDDEPRLTDLAPSIVDFADTAAMVDQMDLVISIDTSVAHLAGALGKPVWALLASVADWRWGVSGDTTPWYPTMRLFRQTRPGDWPSVMERVFDALRVLNAGSSRLRRGKTVRAPYLGGLP